MGKAELDIDPELLAQAKRLGISVAGMSEVQLRLHLQKIDPAGAEARARRWAEENAEAIAEQPPHRGARPAVRSFSEMVSTAA